MGKFCLTCGEPLGAREALNETATCDRCRERAALAPFEKRSKSGLLRFVEEVEQRQALTPTGRLRLPADGRGD